MLLHSNVLLIDKYKEFISDKDEIVIFSPYIKKNALIELLDQFPNKLNTVITSWKPVDLRLGVSDIDVYEVCLEHDAKLLINNSIHLKCITDIDFSSCLISSANITCRGLALAKKHNFELGTVQDNITAEDKSYLDSIIDSSVFVTDDYYSSIHEQVEKLGDNLDTIPEYFFEPIDTRIFVSKLPYFNNPELLFDTFTKRLQSSEQEYRCAIHDVNLYQVSEVKDKKKFYIKIKENFSNDFFMRVFFNYIEEGKRFGEISHWLHNELQDVPAPRRYEVKEYQKRIFEYIRYLLNDQYIIERPNHSEIIRKIG